MTVFETNGEEERLFRQRRLNEFCSEGLRALSSDTGRRGSRMGGTVNVIANTNGCELTSGRQWGATKSL